MRLAVVVLCMFVLLAGGCVKGIKNEAVKSQPVAYSEKPQRAYQQETTSFNYDYEDSFSPQLNERSAKKLSVDSGAQLSAKQVQRALKNAGFYKGALDGKIGSKTKEAIIKFQRAKGLKADGVVGKRTASELRKYLK